MIGEFYFKKESYKAAIDRLESLLTKYPDYKRAEPDSADNRAVIQST